jgi:hypothetical protein
MGRGRKPEGNYAGGHLDPTRPQALHRGAAQVLGAAAPSRFWHHRNRILVLEALSKLDIGSPGLGEYWDPRQPFTTTVYTAAAATLLVQQAIATSANAARGLHAQWTKAARRVPQVVTTPVPGWGLGGDPPAEAQVGKVVVTPLRDRGA